jgi:hypothetical protein
MPGPSVAKVESPLPYLIAAVLVFPSVIWIAIQIRHAAPLNRHAFD